MENNENLNKAVNKVVNKAGDNVPENLRDDKVSKTTVTGLKKLVEDTLLKIEDLATMEIMLPVQTRVRDRYNTIKKMGSAQHLNIQGHWKTVPPKFHIRKLRTVKLSNDEGEILFEVFESDKDGNKKLYTNSTTIQMANGDKVEREISAEYKIAYEVREIIKRGKPITREIIKMEQVN